MTDGGIKERESIKDILTMGGKFALVGVALVVIAENAEGYIGFGWAYLISVLGRGVLAAAVLTAVLCIGQRLLRVGSGKS